MIRKYYKYTIDEKEIDIEGLIARYHFEPADAPFLSSVACFLTELFSVEAEICYAEDQVICVATLGRGYDQLTNLAEDAGKLFLAYTLECFAMEFLSKAYGKMNETVYLEKKKWMGEYRFLGEDDLSKLASYTDQLQSLQVIWQNGMLHPLKSVIFTAAYKEDRKESGCETCEKCQNLTCSFRRVIKEKKAPARAPAPDKKTAAASYGISRIFGGPGGVG